MKNDDWLWHEKVYFFLVDLERNIKNSPWYRKWIYRPYETRTYTSASSLMDRLDESHGFLYEIYFHIKCKLSHIWEWPGDRLRDLKHYHQRGIKGWAVSDAWGFDYYLSRVIIEGLQWLKENKHGCPCLEGYGLDKDPNGQTDEQFEAMQKEWTRILDTMIFTFKVTQRVQDHDLIIPSNDKYFSKAEYIKWKRFCERVNKRDIADKYDIELKSEVISKKDFDKYLEGWKYFRQHYFGLWD
jgi:hypothetical protein